MTNSSDPKMTDPKMTKIRQVLGDIVDPHVGLSLSETAAISDVTLDNKHLRVRIKLGYPALGYKEALLSAITNALTPYINAEGFNLTVDISWKIHAHKVQKGVNSLLGVKNLVAVASGKGGVGKSTVAVNLALSLLAEGAKVGILDADIYGPSQPLMLGNYERPAVNNDKRMIPVISHGLQTMSMGYLVDEQDTPMVWRGPMVSSALQQLTHETEWKDLDYLIVDLPPGTGDIQLTLAQKIPVSGAIIVTTPQDIALLDAKKALNMFRKLEVPILGIVENMSSHVCSHCGEVDHIFGQKGGAKMAEEYRVHLLGSLPLNRRICEQADGGSPIVIAEPTCSIALMYREIARKMTARLSLQSKDLSVSFPSIVIKNS